MKTTRLSAALLTAGVIAGCAPQWVWVRPGTSRAEFESDSARCQYEAASSTATYGSSAPTERTVGGAIGQGIALGFGQAMARENLIQLCMRAKGYSQQTIGSTAGDGIVVHRQEDPYAWQQRQSAQQPTAPSQAPIEPSAMGRADVSAAPAVAGLKSSSKWILNAEALAKNNNCLSPQVGMTAKGAGAESFTAGCRDGTALAITCSYDGCRVLK